MCVCVSMFVYTEGGGEVRRERGRFTQWYTLEPPPLTQILLELGNKEKYKGHFLLEQVTVQVTRIACY